MLPTIVGVGVLAGTLALMAWLLWASFKAEDRQHLAELNEEYKEPLQQKAGKTGEQTTARQTTGYCPARRPGRPRQSPNGGSGN
jgi:hypothetical protein